MDESELQDWRLYRKSGDEAALNRLVERYMSLVRSHATRLIAGRPNCVELDDMVGAGMVGLMRAIRRFEPERGVTFETYAFKVIRGAILDEYRQMDILPRGLRDFERRLDDTHRELYARYDRKPKESELADGLGLTVERLRQNTEYLINTEMYNIEAGLIFGERENSVGGIHTVLDIIPDNGCNPKLDYEQKRLKLDLAAVAARFLSPQQLVVLALYYHEGLSMHEVGHVLGLTESRISQIHKKLLLQLRKRIGAKRGEEWLSMFDGGGAVRQ